MIRDILIFLFAKAKDEHFDKKLIQADAEQAFHKAQQFELLSGRPSARQAHHISLSTRTSKANQNQRNAIWNYLNAAAKGHVEAQYKLGMIYLNGALGTDRNYQHANEWLLKAKRSGHQKAAYALSHAYSEIAM